MIPPTSDYDTAQTSSGKERSAEYRQETACDSAVNMEKLPTVISPGGDTPDCASQIDVAEAIEPVLLLVEVAQGERPAEIDSLALDDTTTTFDDAFKTALSRAGLAVELLAPSAQEVCKEESELIPQFDPLPQTVHVTGNPNTSTAALRSRRKRFCIQKRFFLVRFKKDFVLHVCQSKDLVYQRRKRDSKIAPFAKYQGVWYECIVLAEDVKKSSLLQEIHAASKRSTAVTSRRRLKAKQFVLVQFYPTRDYQVLPMNEVAENKETSTCSVLCPDGVTRVAMLIATGEFSAMIKRQQELCAYQHVASPLRKSLRNPLLEMTPRIIVGALPKTRSLVFKRTLSMQSAASSNEGTVPKTRSPVFKRTLSMQSAASSNEGTVPKTRSPAFKRTLFMQSAATSNEGTVSKTRSPVFKRTISMQSAASSNEGTSHYTDKLLMEIKEDIKILSPESLPCETEEPEDPYATDSGSEYYPMPGECSASSSPAMSISSEVERALNSPINEMFLSKPASPETVSEPPAPESSKPSEIVKSEARPVKAPYKRKASSCLYCKKMLTRIASHLTHMHKDEPEVAATMVITDKVQKRNAWRKLRLEGNNRYNCSMVQSSAGKIITQRRNPSFKQEDYLPCENCKGWFKRKAMYKHWNRCKGSTSLKAQSFGKRFLAENLLPTGEHPIGRELLVKHVYPKLTNDAISKVVRFDDMINRWGMYYCQTHMQDPTKAYLGKNASQKMRELGRLLKTLKEKHGATCGLKDFIDPLCFNQLLDAVRITSGLVDGKFQSPSLPISLGFTLSSCALLLQAEASKTDDDNLYKRSTRFLEVLKRDWTTQISNAARHQLKTVRFELQTTTKLIPLVEDVMTFVKFLRSEEARLLKELEAEFLMVNWLALNRVLLCSLMVFNRKRVGDVEKIQLSNYQNKSEADTASALYESLDPAERLLAASFVHMYTRGKKDSIVPIMIPKNQIASFDKLIQLRLSGNVGEKNKFLFGKGADSFFNGNTALRQLAKASGAKNHNLLRSTSLRKQIATLSQVMNLKDGDLDVVAKYLGHSVTVHRKFYRLQDESLHLARVSRLLLAVSTNNVESIRGKSLDELPIPGVDDNVSYLMPAGMDANADEENSEDCDDGDDLFSNSASNISCLTSDASASTSAAIFEEKKPTAAGVRRVLPVKSSQIHRPWSSDEKNAVLKHLSYCIQDCIVPTKDVIMVCLHNEPVLRSRTWRNIKDFVRNRLRSKKNK